MPRQPSACHFVSWSGPAEIPKWIPDPSRMPTCILVKHVRTSEEQAIWEQLPEVLQREVLVWIDDLHLACETCAAPRKLVWFVNRQNDHDFCMCLPADGKINEQRLAEISVRL
jgi:hypothetical protein